MPFDTSSAHDPAVAESIAVPAVLLVIGKTLDAFEFTAKAVIFLIVSSRPLQLDAAGRVIVVVAVSSQISHVVFTSFVMTYAVASVDTGALRPRVPLICRRFAGVSVPIPVLPFGLTVSRLVREPPVIEVAKENEVSTTAEPEPEFTAPST